MNQIQRLLEQLHDTYSTAKRFESRLAEHPEDDIARINARAILKRRNDLQQRLDAELRATQSDLIQYHIQRPDMDRYPVIAVARAIERFQELVTAVFDALRTVPKQRYRPTPESIALTSLDLAMATPAHSILVSMSIENERLLTVKSDLDQTFERVFRILKTHGAEQLRELAQEVGIASLSRAYAWAENASQFGLDTKIIVAKDAATRVEIAVSKVEAFSLKEAIESKSDETFEEEDFTGELVGIDVDLPRTYFHLKAIDGREIEGALGTSFPLAEHWAVHVTYAAKVRKIIKVRYATGEEKIDWVLISLTELP